MYHSKSKKLTNHSYWCLLGGGVIVGDKDAWADFSIQYKIAVKEMFSIGTFVGND